MDDLSFLYWQEKEDIFLLVRAKCRKFKPTIKEYVGFTKSNLEALFWCYQGKEKKGLINYYMRISPLQPERLSEKTPKGDAIV